MPKCNFANFDVTIRGANRPYTVTAAYRNRTADGVFDQDNLQNEWQQNIAQLDHTMVRADAPTIVAIGSALYRNLITGHVRDLWVSARADLERGKIDGIRLRLALQPPQVAALPWESLYDPDRNSAFAASGNTPLVRVENLYRYVGASRTLQANLPLKILIAAPDDPTGAVNACQEIDCIWEMFDGIDRQKFDIETATGRFTIVDLRRDIDRFQPDIVHIISHGAPDGIQLWQNNRPTLVSSASFRATLERTPSVKLVFLNACLAARGSDSIPFTSVGTQLLQAGIPAVIAMQFEIRDDAAIDFARFLYEELTVGPCPGAIDVAMAYARSSLYALDPGDFSYGTPLLWLNAEDGVIIEFNGDETDSTQRQIDNGTGKGRDEEDADESEPIDVDAEQRWLETVEAEIDISLLPADLNFVKQEWQATLHALRNYLHQLSYLQRNGSKTEIAEKTQQYLEQKGATIRLCHYIKETIREL